MVCHYPPSMPSRTAPMKLCTTVGIFTGETLPTHRPGGLLHGLQCKPNGSSTMRTPRPTPNAIRNGHPLMPFGTFPAKFGLSTQVSLGQTFTAPGFCQLLQLANGLIMRPFSGATWAPTTLLNIGSCRLPFMPFSAFPVEFYSAVDVFRRQALPAPCASQSMCFFNGFCFLTTLSFVATDQAPMASFNVLGYCLPFVALCASPS